MKIDSKERLLYLDVAKALAIIFMILQHAIILFEYDGGEGKSLVANFFLLMGTAPAAPVFMLIYGLFIKLDNQYVKLNIKRGIKLILTGYLLNLIRFTLPLFMISHKNSFNMLFSVDILQMAGLSLIMITLFRKIIINKPINLWIIFMILVFSPFLWNDIDMTNPLAIFSGNNEFIFFPLFPWIVYPLLGVLLKKYLLNREKLKQYLKRLAMIGVCLLICSLLLYDFFPVGDYHRSGFAIHIIIIGFILIWFYLINLFSQEISDKLKNLCCLLSKELTTIYLIQWAIFGWLVIFIGEKLYNSFISVLIAMFVFIITYLLINSSPRLRQFKI